MPVRLITLLVAVVIGAVGCARSPAPVAAPSVPQTTTSTAVQRLRRDLDSLLSAQSLETGTWGVSVHSLLRNDTLFEANPRKLLMPASNMKLVTLAAAAERLGWDFTYETQIMSLGDIRDGTLNGDLLVIGTGDPSIDDWDGQATRLFRAWSEQLKAHGIHLIKGRIIGDDNFLEDEALGTGWAWDDLDKSYATAVGALEFNQNTARVVVTPLGGVGLTPEITVEPDGNGLDLLKLITTGPAGTSPLIETQRRVGSAGLRLDGAVPVGSPTVYRNVSVYNPTVYFMTAFRNALIADGIEVVGDPVDVDDVVDPPPSRASGTLLLSHRSAPLSELARTMMKNSQNLFAENLLLSLGAIQKSEAVSLDDGRSAVRKVLDEWNIPAGGILVADGSGLSRYNVVTAETLVAVLTHVYSSESLRGTFESTLPIAGRDGTLAQRMKETAAEGNARAKTGSLTNARALSGFVKTADGEPLAFSILANHYGPATETVDSTMDAIVVKLAQFSRN